MTNFAGEQGNSSPATTLSSYVPESIAAPAAGAAGAVKGAAAAAADAVRGAAASAAGAVTGTVRAAA